MRFFIPTGPIGHIGISLAVAYLLRLNLAVTVFCGILPDLVDKPLAALLGLTEGRYVGHTLLFIFLIAVAFFLWKRTYGVAALVGGMSHLLLDLKGFVPWFYPFVNYQFEHGRVDFATYFRQYFTLSHIGIEFLIVALAGLILFLGRRLYRWNKEGGRLSVPTPISHFLRRK